jgi:hypothetical protein
MYEREIVGIIRWEKKIKGLNEIYIKEKMRIIKSNWEEIMKIKIK